MSNPIVSVIVPTYNRPEFLERALSSIDAQTYQNYEIVVVNDAGEDISHVVKKYDKAVLVEHKENKGLAGSRNTGVMASNGKYITFLDDDDIIFPNHFTVLVEALDAGADLAYTNCYIWQNDTKLIQKFATPYNKEILRRRNIFPVHCAMVRRTMFDLEMFDEELISHEDYDLWLRFSNYINFKHVNIYTAAYSKRYTGEQISDQDYHINYLWKVREKNNLLNLPPLAQNLRGECDCVVLQDITINVDLESVPLTKNSLVKLPKALADDLMRAGYVSY